LYRSYQGVLSVEERLIRAREALRLEREAYGRMRQEFEEFKHLVAGSSGVDDTVRADMGRLSSAVPSTGTVLVETTDTDTPEQSMSGAREMTAIDEAIVVESASPIVKRVKNDPRTRQPSMLQISPYGNLEMKVYKSRKRARSPVPRQEEEMPPLPVEEE